MDHNLPLITTIAAGLGLALVLGFIAARARLPALVGYLLAGVVIGPFTPGFVADTRLASELAEIGVMLLMFGVGLHFSLGDLLAVRRIAVPGAVVQIVAATAMGVAVATSWGWNLAAALVFGLALSVASTVVLLRALESLGQLDTFSGRIAVGWLVVEDLAMVVVLVLLPPLATALTGSAAADPQQVARDIAWTLLQVALFVALMLVVGRRVFPWLLWQVQKLGSRELFTLCVVAAAVSIAYGATQLFGVSFALGAFFAGMVLRESQFSQRAAEETLPLRDAFAVLFFVSVGMLFDPRILVDAPLRVLAVVGVIVLGKSLAAALLVLLLRYPLATALTGSAAADPQQVARDIAWTLLQVAIFVALMLVVGRRVFPWLLWQVQKLGSRELFTLCVVAAAVSIAYGATQLFGVSFALGAFFAGMVLRESQFSHRAAEETLPLRDAFAVLFFVSVGMLFDPRILLDAPLRVLAVVGVIVLGKSIAAAVLVLVLRYPLHTALTVSASLAQIGEFSFILIGLGATLGVVPAQAQSLVVAGALISIALNPLVFRAIEPLQRWLLARSQLARSLAARDDPLAELPLGTDAKYLSRQVVLVGHGRVGRRLAQALLAHRIPFVVVEQNRALVEELRGVGVPAVYGDAAQPEVLVQAHVARARMLVIATPDTLGVRQMAAHARLLNPPIELAVRSHNEEEARRLEQELTGRVFVGEHELALAMTRHVLERCNA